MSKVKAGLLSLGARGTIGDAVTFQERGRVNFARTKPMPAYRQTLLQLYQRWDYEDYAYLWRQQSEATKALYRTAGSKVHLTGFQYWMKYQLTDLPDLVGRWRLDEKSGVIVFDSSRQGNNGTIIGASPATLAIDGAYYFDALNDYINIPHGASMLMGTGDFNIEFFIKAPVQDSVHKLISKWQDMDNRWYIGLTPANKITFLFRSGAVWVCQLISTPVLVDDTLHHLSYNIVKGDKTYLYVDGTFANSSLAVAGNWDNTGSIHLGNRELTDYGELTLDNLVWRNRLLDTTEILRHSERRYPI